MLDAAEPPPLPPKQRKAQRSHVIKIHINPDEVTSSADSGIDIVMPPCIRINVGNGTDLAGQHQDSQFYYFNSFNMSSGQVSPSDTLDSGTCSDLDCTPPPLPTKTKNKEKTVTVTVIGATHKRIPSLTSNSGSSSAADADSDDNLSNISCDSLNNLNNNNNSAAAAAAAADCVQILPRNLLRDIRQCNQKDLITPITPATVDAVIHKDQEESTVEEKGKVFIGTYEERQQKENASRVSFKYETDKFYEFHLNERVSSDWCVKQDSGKDNEDDESFAGYKDLLSVADSATIRSAKGTVRGVKNRVRAGIATFLQINDQTKTYKEKDGGKVVVYTTTMGIVRDTYQSCMKVKQILRTLLVKYEERDVFMSTDYQAEIRDRMRCDYILVPQVFVDGQHIGDAETVEKLNESGELRRILKPYKSMDVCTTCKVCGGFNLLPCPVCNGSKKSVHRNDFTAEFVALKCMNCDEVGLVKCTACAL